MARFCPLEKRLCQRFLAPPMRSVSGVWEFLESDLEESSSWLQRRWRHERTLTSTESGGCTIEDRLVIEPRLRLFRPVVSAVVEQLFAHRHRRLVKRFGGPVPSQRG